MKTFKKTLSSLIIISFAIFMIYPVYADDHHHGGGGHDHGGGDIGFGIYFNPFYSPYYYPDGYVVEQPYYYQRHYVAPATAPSSLVMKAQVQLYTLGYYRGSVDGIMGPGTQSAITSFQRDKGLPQTGILDDRTLNSLGVS